MEQSLATYAESLAAPGALAAHAATRWYAIAVRKGSEVAAARRVTRAAGPVLAEPAFRPAFEAEMRVRGEWVRAVKPLLEGYVIAVTDDVGTLEESLEIAGPCRLVGTGDEPSPLSREATLLLGGLGEPGRRVVPLSRGRKLASGGFVVDEGPLRGHEALIERVDRHKSLAYLRVDVAGESVRARAGLALLPDGAVISSRTAMPEGWAQPRLEGGGVGGGLCNTAFDPYGRSRGDLPE